MSAPALRLVQGGQRTPAPARSFQWGSATPGGLLAEAPPRARRDDDTPRCLCGQALTSKKCACCGMPVADCPECPRTVWRDGRRVVALARCDNCVACGCRYSDSSTWVIRCRPDVGAFSVRPPSDEGRNEA